MDNRKRYAVVGTGTRVVMFLDAIAGRYRETSVLVGLCDVSRSRMEWHNRRLTERFGTSPVPMYPADAFDRMIAEQKPDVVIVTSVDATHHIYAIRAMELGCDVLCEKPLTIDAERARAILDAIERTGRRLRVTFNVRYTPYASRVRELIASGVIGQPMAADLQWVLDTSHGADYFRRWHACRQFSGGLLIHKATHHFDMVNWWIGSYPQTVFAFGDLKFYGAAAAANRGEQYTYDRYLDQPAAANDPFRFAWEKHPDQRELYTGQAERESGYIRDRNVFGPHVDIEDTIALTARYRNGVIFSYSLVAYSPWEGFRAAVTGTRGRIELFIQQGSHILTAKGDDELAEQQSVGEVTRLRVFPMFGQPYDVPLAAAAGGHGGGDPVMLEALFAATPPPDPLGQAATHLDGVASILMGIAGNRSIATGQPVHCDDLVRLPPHPASQDAR